VCETDNNGNMSVVPQDEGWEVAWQVRKQKVPATAI
jgi:hypothetical protein